MPGVDPLDPDTRSVLSTVGHPTYKCLGCGHVWTSEDPDSNCPSCTVPATPPEPQETPRVSGKVIGYRQWTLDNYRLRALAIKGASWSIGPNRARCMYQSSGLTYRLGPHDAPHPDCECGLYAYHHVPIVDANIVLGAVTAWGRLQAHSDGFRAEYAEPVVLAWSGQQSFDHVRAVQAVGSELGLPVVELGELEDAAAQFGKPVAEELRPGRALLADRGYRGSPFRAYPSFHHSFTPQFTSSHALGTPPPPALLTWPQRHTVLTVLPSALISGVLAVGTAALLARLLDGLVLVVAVTLAAAAIGITCGRVAARLTRP